MRRLAREPAAVAALLAVAAVTAKIVAKAVGIHFFLHPGVLVGAILVAVFAIGVPLTVRRMRRDA